jgi:hypothetical protein
METHYKQKSDDKISIDAVMSALGFIDAHSRQSKQQQTISLRVGCENDWKTTLRGGHSLGGLLWPQGHRGLESLVQFGVFLYSTPTAFDETGQKNQPFP